MIDTKEKNYQAPAVKVIELECQNICNTSNVNPGGTFGLNRSRMEEEDI